MKKIFAIVITVLLLISVAACNNNASADLSNVSAEEIAVSVKEGTAFLDDMFEVDNEVVAAFYKLPEGITDLKVYMSSSGATAEELAIFKCDNEQTAELVMKACEKRIDDLNEKFEEYIPDELVKLENAVITKRDCFVMFVCADSTDLAEEKFEDYK